MLGALLLALLGMGLEAEEVIQFVLCCGYVLVMFWFPMSSST
jgi:hypothetical protein